MRIHRRTPYLLQLFIWIPTQLALNYFVRRTIIGKEHIQNLKGPVIFASNHISELDPIVLPAAFPMFSPLLPAYYVSRPAGHYLRTFWRDVFYGGTFFSLWGAYPAASGNKDYLAALEIHRKIIALGKSLMIFPEGGIVKDPNEVRPARGGVAALIEATNATVIPMAIHGVRDISFKEFFGRKRKLTVVFGPPMDKSEIFANVEVHKTDNHYQGASRNILNRIRTLLNGLPVC